MWLARSPCWADPWTLRLCGIAMPCLADLQFIFYNFVFHFLFLISQRKFDCRPKMCAQVRPPATTTRAGGFVVFGLAEKKGLLAHRALLRCVPPPSLLSSRAPTRSEPTHRHRKGTTLKGGNNVSRQVRTTTKVSRPLLNERSGFGVRQERPPEPVRERTFEAERKKGRR
jgi:hypothetical protein